MAGLTGLISVGTVASVSSLAIVAYWFVRNLTQKKHTLLRNVPVIGRLVQSADRSAALSTLYRYPEGRVLLAAAALRRS